MEQSLCKWGDKTIYKYPESFITHTVQKLYLIWFKEYL